MEVEGSLLFKILKWSSKKFTNILEELVSSIFGVPIPTCKTVVNFYQTICHYIWEMEMFIQLSCYQQLTTSVFPTEKSSHPPFKYQSTLILFVHLCLGFTSGTGK